jgi:putative membrane protein
VSRNERELSKGLIAGLVGGLIGTMVMTEFQNICGKAPRTLRQGTDASAETMNHHSDAETEDSTMKAAGKIGRLVGRELSHEEREKLGPVVHYSFGTVQGAVYGSVLELAGERGGLLPALLFGSTLFIVADEIVVPALGLSRKAGEAPLSAHLYGLASHLVYAVTTEIARRGVRAALD